MEKILIVKTSSLGDIIQTFPVLQYLRSRNPKCCIDWVVEKSGAELLRRHPEIGGIIEMNTYQWRKTPFSSNTRKELNLFKKNLQSMQYDYVFDLQGNIKSAWVLAKVRGKKKIGFGWKTVPEKINYFFTHHHINPPKGKNIREDYLWMMQSFFKNFYSFNASFLFMLNEREKNQLNKIPNHSILVCPCSRWENKQVKRDTLVKFLKSFGKIPFLFAWGNQKEREIAINLAALLPNSEVLPLLSFPLLQHVMAQSKLIVAMDSLPLHLAGTTSTPTVSFFGPSSALKYRPFGEQHLSFQGTCPYNVQFEKRCPQLRTCKTGSCLKDLNYQELQNSDVFQQVQSHFES